jgi:hypothetical protein
MAGTFATTSLAAGPLASFAIAALIFASIINSWSRLNEAD